MNIFSINLKKFLIMLFSILIILIFIIVIFSFLIQKNLLVMGAVVSNTCNSNIANNSPIQKTEADAYFRPSNTKSLNTRIVDIPLFDGLDPKISSIISNKNLLISPEDTILNYYSILREASNPQVLKSAGCGTIGIGKLSYPVTYNFFTKEYIKKVKYSKYVRSFSNILHINLLKLKEVPSSDNTKRKYFIELETIEGTCDKSGGFKYYYGYIVISKENDLYKISDIALYNEVYLCAPYHGWNYVAENIIDIEYGNWCNMVIERLPTINNGFSKKVPFKSHDGKEYMVEFFILTNDYDIKISDYVKDKNGKWNYTLIDTNSCLDKKN